MLSDLFKMNTYGEELRRYVLVEDIFLYAPIVTLLFTLLMGFLIILFLFFIKKDDKIKRCTAYSIYGAIGLALTVFFFFMNFNTYSDIFSNETKEKEITIVSMENDKSKIRKKGETRGKEVYNRFIIKDENENKYIFLSGVNDKIFEVELKKGQTVKIEYYPNTKIINGVEYLDKKNK